MYILYAIQPADAPQGPRFLRWTTDASPTLPWMGCRNTYQTVGLQLGLPYDCQIKVENWTLMGARSYIARTALCTCNLAQPGWIGLADERRKTNLQNGGECEVESCVGLSCILIYIDVLYVCVYLCIELFYGHQIYVVSLYVYIYTCMYAIVYIYIICIIILSTTSSLLCPCTVRPCRIRFDQVVAINGHVITSMEDLPEAMAGWAYHRGIPGG